MPEITLQQAFEQAVQLHQAGRTAEAEPLYRLILEHEPMHAPTLHYLGVLLGQSGRLAEGAQIVQRATLADPNQVVYYSNLSNLQRELGQLDESVASARRAIELSPAYIEGYLNLAATLQRKKDWDQAIAASKKVIELSPDSPQGYASMAVSMERSGQIDDAITACQRAIDLDPNMSEAYGTLGASYLKKYQWESAAAACQRAVSLRPGFADAYGNLALALGRMGKNVEAEDASRRAIQIKPDLFSVHWNLALLLLKQGRFAEGWKEYEWRRSGSSPWRKIQTTQPQWKGEPIEGKTILLHTEQGIGDAFQFVRYVPLVAQRGANIVLLVPNELLTMIMPSLGNHAIVTDSVQGGFDVYCSLQSLPGIFQTDLNSIPRNIPYLVAVQQLIEVFTGQFDPADRRKRIGLVWAGSPTHVHDSDRSIPVHLLSPFRSCPVAWHSLQKYRKMPTGPLLPDFAIVDHSDELPEFSDTAALIHHLDLVITVDTAVAHLAGAMGKPVWVMLPSYCDWRWMTDREDCPWYPSMRLFRQKTAGDWPDVIQRVIGELNRWVESGTPRA